MIVICAKFAVKPEHADAWPELARSFTEAVNAEDGCLWFEWSRSVTDPHTYVLLEAFRDEDAGAAHVQSDHFQAATRDLPQYLTATPQVVNAQVDADGWSALGEMSVD